MNIDFQEVQKKWQKAWKDASIYKTVEDPNKPKFYVLDMFPYPSGSGLHVGHPKGYIATDVIARKKMLEGFSVLHPMGFDTFGLGTEQYAIDNKMKPQVVAEKNINNFIEQLKNIGLTYDRDRSFSTADPEYFRWTQWIFLQLYSHYYDEKEQKAKPLADLEEKLKKETKGNPAMLEKKSADEIKKILDSERLAYIDYKPINRCPKCMTGLANEDLDDGKCERCASEVEQKPMRQRVLRITKYADRLISGLEGLNRDESMKDLERNWIGKSEGTQFAMKIKDSDSLSFEVYTTRIDTVFGMSFVVMAPEHKLVDQITTVEYKKAVEDYKEQANHKSQLERTELQKEKTGQFTGAYAINPFNSEEIPVFVGDYVLANYGTGVVMAVPAHDERDYEFAKKYNLSIVQSIAPTFGERRNDSEVRNTISAIIRRKSDNNFLLLKWKKFDWISPVIGGIESNEDIFTGAVREVLEETGYNAEPIKTIGRITESNFFADNKNVFRKRYDQVVLLEIDENQKNEIESSELEKHEVIWMTYEEAMKNITHEYNKLGIQQFIHGESAYTEKGILLNSGEFSGLTSDEAIVKMQEWLEKNAIGGKKSNYKINDRVFSRQRYWGEPFPIVFCDDCGVVAMEAKDLPQVLPDVENYAPTGTEEGPLADIDEWMNIPCPHCGKAARRESNTMPGRAGSSRYWLRYMDPKNEKELVGTENEKYRGSVDVYVGGAEHVTRHMIYARFRQKFLFDLGIVTHDEPFQKYRKVGLIMAEDGRKMSKRRGNVVNPNDIINENGADTLRTYEMFMGPFEQSIARSTNGIKGAQKFLERVVNLFDKIGQVKHTSDVLATYNFTIKKLTEDCDDFKYNTAIAQLMIFTNELTAQPVIDKKVFENLIILLSPFAPHLAEEMREKLGNEFSIFTKAKRPTYDPSLLVSDTVNLAVQFNGKSRGVVVVGRDIDQDQALEAVKADEKLNKYLTGEPKKIIYVKGKIINIIV